MKTKEDNAVRFYTRRDSATCTLRKMGIKSSDYGKFITEIEDGRFACKVAMAELHLQMQAAKHGKPKKKDPTTIASVCRQMITDGKDNETIFKALQKRFGKDRIDKSKRHYPAWFRSEMKRKKVV